MDQLHIPKPGLGWRKQEDANNYRYLMATVLPDRVARKDLYWPMFSQVLNQGATSTCVGHGGKHQLLMNPAPQTKRDGYPTAYDLYWACCRIDPWPENDGGNLNIGTSPLALARVMQTMGFLEEYRWAYSVDTIADWLCTRGPVGVGLPWYSSMYSLDKEGYIRVTPTAVLDGGHYFVLGGWSEGRGAARCVNSWGRGWGQLGRFWMDGETLERLLREDGEAMTAIERRKE